MRSLYKKLGVLIASIFLILSITTTSSFAKKIRIALAETPSDELAAFFVALDRAKANGLEYEWTAFADEELAIQAILSGQMDIGFGTPYSAMQKSKAPVRIIFQLSKLKFFPVTSTKYSKLEDLNGEPIMLHSRGGGTDSIANVIEDKLNIKFGTRSYVPGSSNRVAALVAGKTDATIVDLSNKNKLKRLHGDKFNVLPMFEVDASDEALFANVNWIKKNSKDVDIFVKALVSVYKDMDKDPTIIRRETNPDGPIGQLPKEVLDELDGFYTDAVAGGFIVLIFAYVTRFLAVGNAAIRSGILKVHPNAMDASSSMGIGFYKSIRKIILPLIYSNVLVGGILVFVDILKELPITLLLRPFNFETLSTYVYQYASDELLQESSFAALIIILVGLGPVIFLNSKLQRVSKKKKSS